MITMDRVLDIIRRNSARLDRIEAALGLKADRLEEAVTVHEERLTGLEKALDMHWKDTNRHRPVDVPPVNPAPPRPEPRNT